MKTVGAAASALERRQPGLLAALPPYAPALFAIICELHAQ